MFRNFNQRSTHYLVLGIVWVGLCLPNLGAPSLWDIDEGHNAEAAREMLVASNVVVPTFNYRWRHDKPALLYWLQMGAYQLFGVNEFSARLPSAFAALATILITYELARRIFTATTALLAGVVLASTVCFCAAARFANPDALLLTFTTLLLFVFWKSFAAGDRAWFLPAGFAAGLAMLAKGPVGIVLPGAVIGLFLFWSNRLRMLWDVRLVGAGLVAALVALPWYIAVAAETKGEFLREFFLRHNAGRFSETMEGHGGSWFYYGICLLIGFAPWCVFIGPTMAYAIGRRARADVRNDESTNAYCFLWCWIGVYFVFFTLSATKLPNYVLPVYAPLAILTGRFLDRWRLGTLGAPNVILQICLGCFALIGIGVAAGLTIAGGTIDIPVLRGRKFPGLETWAVIGLVPIIGAGIGWWLLSRQRRTALMACMAATAALFVGMIAAGGAVAVDAHKAVRPLAHILPPGLNQREVRIACYGYYQPSLVFYCRRQVARIETEADALEFLRYPLEVYLFVPERVWDSLASQVPSSCHVLGRHECLYRGEPVVVVTNR